MPVSGNCNAYLTRFHVQMADGKILGSTTAFVALWSVLPGWRWLRSVGRLAKMVPVLEVTYRLFLKGRPMVQRFAR